MIASRKPMITTVDGIAWGSGFALAMACDLIVAIRSATFAVPAVRRGMIGGIVLPMLAFCCGGSIAARTLMTGELMKSRAAIPCGLVTLRPPSAQI